MDNHGCTLGITHDLRIDSIAGTFSGSFTLLHGEDSEYPDLWLSVDGYLGTGAIDTFDIIGQYSGYLHQIYYDPSLECWHASLSLIDGYECGMFIYTD